MTKAAMPTANEFAGRRQGRRVRLHRKILQHDP